MRNTAIPLALAAACLAGCEQPQHSVEMQTPAPASSESTQETQPPRLGEIRTTDPADNYEIAPRVGRTSSGPDVPSDAGEAEASTPNSQTPPDPPRLSETPGTTTPEGAETYTIRKGDTLWGIATSELGDGQRWRDIAQLNPGLDPTRMRVGQQIMIPAE